MKKLFGSFLAAALLLVMAVPAFATSGKGEILDDADITNVTRLAIATPIYTPPTEAKTTPPTREEIVEIMENARNSSNCYVLTYDEVAQNIKQDINIDIRVLEKKKAAKIYAENIAKYCDAYVLMMATGLDNKRPTLFFGVHRAKDSVQIYDYRVNFGRTDVFDVTTMKEAAEGFFKEFDRSAKAQEKDREKEAKKQMMMTLDGKILTGKDIPDEEENTDDKEDKK